MANGQSIDEIVSKAAFDQIAKLEADLQRLNDLFVKAVLSINDMNRAIGNASSLKELTAAVSKSALENEKLNKLRTQNLILEQKLQQEIIKTNIVQDRANQLAEDNAKKQAAKTAEIDKQTKTIISNSQAEIDAYNKSVGGSTNVTSTINKQNSAEAQLANAVSSVTKATKESTAANDKLTLSKKQLALMAAQEKANNQQNALSLKNLAKELNAAKGSLDQRAAALARLQKVFSGLNEEERASPFGQRLSKVIPQLNDQVLGLEKSIGKSQRNVGNYLSTFTSGLGSVWQGLKTVANILPGVGLAGLLGFALDPMLAYIQTLDIFKKKIDQLLETRKMLNDVNLKGAQDAQQEIAHLKILYDTSRNVELSSIQRYKAAKSLQELYPETFKNYTIEQIELGKVDAAYLKLSQAIIATARARASEQKIAENSSRILDDERQMTDLQAERTKAYSEMLRINKETAKVNTSFGGGAAIVDARVEAARKVKDLDEQIFKLARDREILNKRNLALTENIVTQQKKGADIADYKEPKAKKEIDTSAVDQQKAIVDTAKIAQKEIIDSEKSSFIERYGALENYLSLSNNAAELDYNKKIKLGEKESVAYAEWQKDRQKNLVESNKLFEKLTKESNKKELESATENQKKEIQTLRDSNADRLTEIEKFRSDSIKGIADQYSNGIISKKQYEQQLHDIEVQSAEDTLQVQIDALQKIIDIQKKSLGAGIGTDKELGDSKKKLAALEIEKSKLAADSQVRDKERVAEASKRLRDKQVELARDVFDLGKTLIDASFTNQLNAVQGEIDLNDKKKQQDIENVNSSVASEQEKADKIAVINARADAQKTMLEQKQRDIKLRQAKFDRAASIAKAISETALAVIEALPNIPLSILVGALGAVQIATILATPLPTYYTGTESSKGGPAWTDELGPELYIEPGGNMFIGDDKPNIKNLKAGTQIIPHHETVKLLAKAQLNSVFDNSIDFKPLMDVYNNSSERIVKAIKSNGKGSHTIITKRGWSTTHNGMNGLNSYLGRNV